MTFAGKVALVTGGASGMGREACRLLAGEGAKVVVVDWNGAEADEAAREFGADAFRADVSIEHDTKAMIEFAFARHGRLDILINNAGVGHSASNRYRMASVVDTPEEAWDSILAINLKGVAMACKHAIPRMARQGGGAIVNNASICGMVGLTGADAYAASKGGVIALTRAMAMEWGPRGIRVNCVCPGAVDTPMLAPAFKDPGFVKFVQDGTALRRAAKAEEIARVMLYLASDQASYITGAILPVDGGFTAI